MSANREREERSFKAAKPDGRSQDTMTQNQNKKTRVKTKVLFRYVWPALMLVGCATNRDHTVQHNKEIIRRYFDRWANRGDTVVADEVIAPHFTLRNPPAVISSLEDYKRGMAGFHTSFPDLRFTIEDQIAAGDRVVVRWTMRGTNLGEYQGRPPTGKTITVTGISIFRIADGKIQEIHVSMDRNGMLEQLGWLPAPTPPTK